MMFIGEGTAGRSHRAGMSLIPRVPTTGIGTFDLETIGLPHVPDQFRRTEYCSDDTNGAASRWWLMGAMLCS